jgi:hypothetical protein
LILIKVLSNPNSEFEAPAGDVMMTAFIAGLVISKHPTNPKLCRCIQIIHGDLGGWLPKSVVSMVTTQAFPISMRRVNKKLRLIENPRIISELIKSSQNTNEQVAIISNKVENVVKIIKKDTKVKVSEKMDTLNFIIGLVNKAQPWLVLILFISHFLSKRK